MRGVFLPYKFIGDVAYPMRPWFYSHFKEEKEGLTRKSDAQYPIEHAHGCKKGVWDFERKMADFNEIN
jgi:hypothetical protein